MDAAHHYLKLGQPYEITTTLKGPSDLIYPQGSVITFKFKARDGMPPLELNWYDGQGNNPPAPPGYTENMGMAGSFTYAQDCVIKGTSHGASYQIIPDAKRTELENAGKLPKPKGKLSNHYGNFLNACQGIEPVNSPFEISAPLAEMLCLGCIGQRFGGTLEYDAEAMKITNHPQADAMLKGPEVRKGWSDYDQQQPVKSKKAQIKSPDKAEWEMLFTDASLSNWENPYEWGKAEFANGEVSLTTEKEGGKWFLLTKKEYANFVLEGEIMMPVNKGNSGFMFRCQKRKNKVWGYQAEVDTAERKWSGGIYDEGRRGWFVSPNRDHAGNEEEKNKSITEFRARAGECFKQGQWNKYRIACIGDHIQIYVNDTLTTDIYDSMDIQGPVGIQHHGEKGLTYKFRNLRIQDLGAGGEVYYPHREGAKAAAVPSKMKGDIYEAETAVLNGCKIADNPTGYQGTGFVVFEKPGGYVEWNNVLAESDGKHILTFRYTSDVSRSCDLLVNGSKVSTVDFAGTGSGTKWKTVKVNADFKKGGNFVKVVAINGGLNLDAMAVNK
jgi:hypothetical protein